MDLRLRHSGSLQGGSITQWMDEKGHGWVASGSRRYFVHVKDFDRGQRRPRVSEGAWWMVILLLVLPLTALVWLPFPWWMGAGVMLLASVLTYTLYAHDKHQAVSGGWRVPESSLHFGELLGGWPGALFAQQGLRHKCSKLSYQLVFWAIVAFYQIASLDVMLGHRLSHPLIRFLSR